MDGVLILVLVWLLLALPVAIVIGRTIRRADEPRYGNHVIDVDALLHPLNGPFRPLATRDATPAPRTAIHHTGPVSDVGDAPPDHQTRRPSPR
jgi:hypothetical protein